MQESMETSEITQWFLQWYAQFPWVFMLIAMMLLDVLSGLIAAGYAGKICSKVGYRGMMRKASMLLVVAAAGLLEQGIIMSIPQTLRGDIAVPFAKLVSGIFFINEAISVLENAKACGVPLPAFLTRSLADQLSKLTGSHDVPQGDVHLEIEAASLKATVKHDETRKP